MAADDLRTDDRLTTPDEGVPSLPSFATHYFPGDRLPFLNLSDLDLDEADRVMADMDRLRAAGRQFRPFGRRYLELRRLTEQRLRELFIAAGGQPERAAPHSFVLGASRWWQGLVPGARRARIELADLPPAVTSVTYPDSFVAMEIGPAFGIEQTARPYHGQVFTLDQLPDLVARHGIPDPPWRPEHRDWRTWPEETFIEIQVWADGPLAKATIEPAGIEPAGHV